MPTHPRISRVLLHSRMTQRSTATEHAEKPDSSTMHASARSLMSSGRERGYETSRERGGSTATEHAKTRMPGCEVVLQSNPESMQAMEAAQLILHRYASIFPNASMNSKAPKSSDVPDQLNIPELLRRGCFDNNKRRTGIRMDRCHHTEMDWSSCHTKCCLSLQRRT